MTLTEFIASRRPGLLDGAMGTQLADRGLEMGGQNCITHPEDVLAVHGGYVDSGSVLLITNTLTMNRICIENHKLNIDVREVNLKGAEVARSAAGDSRYVLGDIGATGKLLEPYGDLSEPDAIAAYREQASILAEGGVDGFIVETMTDLREACCALGACKSVSELPVFVSMAFSTAKNGGCTIMGDTAENCARTLTGAGAQGVGANCGDLDPAEIAKVASILKENTSLPVLTQPNAGKPKLMGDQTVFDMPPPEFAQGILKCLEAGARFVGGCCGTTPAHVSAAAAVLKQFSDRD